MRVSAVATTRNLLGPLVRTAYRIYVSGAHHVPSHGGLLLIANHPGIADATLLGAAAPRPVRVVSEAGALAGAWSLLSAATGRIVVSSDEDAPAALRQAVAAIDAGEAVGMFPEGRLPSVDDPGRAAILGPAYVQVRTGAKVVPVALLGSHGRRPTDPPAPRSTVDVVFGEAFRLPAPIDPLSRAAIVDVAESLRQRLADHVMTARARTGRVAVDDPSAPRKDGAP
ncbi:MAG: 1-acyl-sn-glycerol-3-phosphate acyltransferase [Actinomycetales bacterium]|nr:1-acyl-sn-glycerol-3-phosphate acyltransferase [Actinomycetales bacterium]